MNPKSASAYGSTVCLEFKVLYPSVLNVIGLMWMYKHGLGYHGIYSAVTNNTFKMLKFSFLGIKYTFSLAVNL